jgi:hypothetical protein
MVAALAPAGMDAPLSSDFGPFIGGGGSEGESLAACGPAFLVEVARKANGKAAKSALSLSSE